MNEYWKHKLTEEYEHFVPAGAFADWRRDRKGRTLLKEIASFDECSFQVVEESRLRLQQFESKLFKNKVT